MGEPALPVLSASLIVNFFTVPVWLMYFPDLELSHVDGL